MPQKIALVHDFLREYGGGERVLEALHQMFPQAPVYVAFVDKQSLGKHWQRFADWNLRQTWFSRIPLHKKFYSPLRWLAPLSFADVDLSAYDIVISSANAFGAKAVTVPNGKHVCYCHTPPRSLYGYSTMSDWKKNPLIRIGGQVINHFMRTADFNQAQQVDLFVANSQETQARISKFYRRDAMVIHPPVKLSLGWPELKQIKQQQWGQRQSSKQLQQDSQPGYYFYIGRLGLQKHPELAVQVCTQLGLNLKVAGTGPMLEGLKQLAGPTVEFLGSVTDEQLAKLYAGAKALLYPVEDEDFGMVPVEAMLAGTPVIAHASGGPVETVTKRTGILFEELTIAGLKQAVRRFEAIEAGTKLGVSQNKPKNLLDADQIREWAEQYSRESFQEKMNQLIEKEVERQVESS